MTEELLITYDRPHPQQPCSKGNWARIWHLKEVALVLQPGDVIRKIEFKEQK